MDAGVGVALRPDIWPVGEALLDKIHLGPDLGRTAGGPHLQFMEGGGNQFDYSLHEHASDMLALSLLQARLIDLNLPIEVACSCSSS